MSSVTRLSEVRDREQLSQSVEELLKQGEEVLVVVRTVRHWEHLLEEEHRSDNSTSWRRDTEEGEVDVEEISP